MQFFNDLNQFSVSSDTIVTIGSFDGIHPGHDFIFNQLRQFGKRHQLKTVVVSFYPHPSEVVRNTPVHLLSSPEEKRLLMEKKGIDAFVILNFTKELSQLTYDVFVQKILIKTLRMKFLLVGYDHALGKNRQGTFNNLHKLSKTLNFGIAKVDPLYKGELLLSSSAIRSEIKKGDVVKAATYLGRFYSISGKVVDGEKRGRVLEFPTANVKPLEKRKLVPKQGVYLVKTILKDQSFFGMCNIGVNPTFDGTEAKIEVHIFDFKKTIYGQEITVEFLNFIRTEKKFKSADELKKQLRNDEISCRLLIKNA